MKLKFIKDVTHRDGQGSSKKLWFNLACLTATVIMLYLTYKLPTEFGVDDWVFIWLFGLYLICVGGFDVILEMMRLMIKWKNGGQSVGTTDSK